MSIKLEETNDRFVLTPQKSDESLSISRKDGSTLEGKKVPVDSNQAFLDIWGVVGIFKFVKGKYLVVITDQKNVATIAGTDIFQLMKVEVLSLSGDYYPEDTPYVNMIRSLLHEENFFYFTRGGKYDITNTFSSQASNKFKDSKIDGKFSWNSDFIPEPYQNRTLGARTIFVNMIQGSVESFDHGELHFLLISRRYKIMSGTRYLRRGVDFEGNCANYVETEQIIFCGEENVKGKSNGLSYLIVRGSIPIVWTQKPDLNYNPKIDTSESLTERGTDAFVAHYKYMLGKYGGKVMNVDLTKGKGSEKGLKDAFFEQVKKMNDANVRHVSFDMHKICGQTRFHKISILQEEVTPFLEEEDGRDFSDNLDPETPVEVQDRLLRVNCKDSLDRTNFIQTHFAKLMLNKMLHKIGYFKNSEDSMLKFPGLHQKLLECWSDNGDKISRLYSGSGALRTTVTRRIAGKQTIMGLIRDGKKSVFRYYQNNLADGYKQDCIDLLTRGGKVDLEIKEEKDKGIVAMIVAIIMILLKPKTTPDKRKWFIGMALALWCLVIVVLFAKLFVKGKTLVDSPKLVKNEYEVTEKKKKEN